MKGGGTKMPTLKFYDVKTKKKFTTDKYKIERKRNTRTGKMVYFAVAISSSGTKCYRIIPKSNS